MSEDKKQSRQDELAALRNRGLTSNNAEKLATGAMPTNMQDWQARQRAMKQQERQNKAAAASTLKQFRGVTEQQAKLTAIRKEERQRQIDAQTTLRSYKANLSDVQKGMTKTQKKRPKNLTSGVEQAVIEETGGVSVSELADAFNQKKQEDLGPLIGEGKTWVSPYSDRPETEIAPELLEEPSLQQPLEQSVESVVMVHATPQVQATLYTPPVMVTAPPRSSPSDESWTNVNHEDAKQQQQTEWVQPEEDIAPMVTQPFTEPSNSFSASEKIMTDPVPIEAPANSGVVKQSNDVEDGKQQDQNGWVKPEQEITPMITQPLSEPSNPFSSAVGAAAPFAAPVPTQDPTSTDCVNQSAPISETKQQLQNEGWVNPKQAHENTFPNSGSMEPSADIGIVNQSAPSDPYLIADATRQIDDAVMFPVEGGAGALPVPMTSPSYAYDTPVTPAPSFAAPEPARVDVEFYFALITTSMTPDYSTYMNKVRTAAEGASTWGPRISFNKEYQPYVRNVVPDGSYYDAKGRPDAKKLVVYATIPIFVPSVGETSEARRTILRLLREAVQAGSLNA